MNKSNFSDDLSKLATVKQGTERYKVSRGTLMKYADQFDALVRFGRSVRIDIEKFDNGLDQRAGKGAANV